MKRVWGCNDGKRNDHDPLNSSSNDDSPSNTLGGGHNSLTRDPDHETRPAEETGGNLSVRESNGDWQGGHEHRTSTVAAPIIREAWALTSRPAGTMELSPHLHHENARKATAIRSNISPGILGILRRVRNSLAAGGMRAAFQLLRGFREGDQQGNGKVKLSAFKKAVGGAALGLKEAEMRIVFQARVTPVVRSMSVEVVRRAYCPP